jgi:hypothetical protein
VQLPTREQQAQFTVVRLLRQLGGLPVEQALLVTGRQIGARQPAFYLRVA